MPVGIFYLGLMFSEKATKFQYIPQYFELISKKFGTFFLNLYLMRALSTGGGTYRIDFIYYLNLNVGIQKKRLQQL